MKDAGTDPEEELPTAIYGGLRVYDSAESVAEARRVVVRQLSSWGLAELADDTRLVVSELLTNAALHARPPIRMRLGRLQAGVRVEVSDGSSELPLSIRAGPDVMTGRGWSLVRALCRDWGVDSRDHGKVVWATLTLAGAQPTAEKPTGDSVADSRTVDAELLQLSDEGHAEPGATRYEVRLGDVPTPLLIAAKAHIDALLREFALMASGAVAGKRLVPAELTTLMAQVVGNFAEARQSIKKQALQAAERYDPRTVLTLNLPVTAAEAGVAYLAALDEVDAYCRAERMLTLETPPAHRVFRRWYVEELVAGLRRASDRGTPEAAHQPETFESRLLREYEQLSHAYDGLRPVAGSHAAARVTDPRKS